MSQSGVSSINVAPSGNVTNLVDNAGNVVTPDILGAIQVKGQDSSFTLGTTPHVLKIFGSSSFLVDKAGNAPYTTIGAAITAAVAAGASESAQANIVVKPGVYVENITIGTAGCNIIGWDPQQSEMFTAASTTIKLPSVIIQGGITVNAEAKIENVGIEPPTTVAAFTFTTNQTIQLVSCKVQLLNAPCFTSSAGNVQIIAQNCLFTASPASTTDKFTTGSGTGIIRLFLDSCSVFFTTVSNIIAVNVTASNSWISNNWDLTAATSSISSFQFTACYCDAGSGGNFINSPTGVLQFTAYNSTFQSATGSMIALGNASSSLKAYDCSFFGTNSIGALTSVEYMNASIEDQSGDTFTSTCQSILNAARRLLYHTGALGVRDTLQVTTSGSNASTVWGTVSTVGFALGVNVSVGNHLRLTQAATTNTDATSGNLVWDIDPTSGNLMTHQAPVQVNAGFAYQVRVPGAYPYNVVITDVYIRVDTTAARTINLPNAGFVTGQFFTVKDTTGTAGTHNITVTSASGLITIDGGITYVMNLNYQAASFLWNGTSYEVF